MDGQATAVDVGSGASNPGTPMSATAAMLVFVARHCRPAIWRATRRSFSL